MARLTGSATDSPAARGLHPHGVCVAEPNPRYNGHFTRATIRYPAIRASKAQVNSADGLGYNPAFVVIRGRMAQFSAW